MNGKLDSRLSIDWDGLSEGATPTAPTEPNDAHLIAALESLFATPLPGAARERARQRLRAALDVDSAQSDEIVVLSPTTSKPTLPSSRSSRPSPIEFHRSSRLAFAAIVACLFLLAGGLVVYWGGSGVGPQNEQDNVIPAVIDNTALEWRAFRGTSTRDGVTGDAGPTTEPALLWSVEIGGSARMAPAVADGLVYIGSSTKQLFALDADTGEERWRFEGDASLQMTPTVADGMVYIPSAYGTLYALDALTGQLRWTFSESLGPYSMPAIEDGILFVGSMFGTFYAIDARSGTTIWTFATGEPFQRPAAVADGVVYAGNDDGTLYALDTSDGAIIWQQEIGQMSVGMPSVANGSIYLAQTGNGILALDQITGVRTMTMVNPGRSGLGSPAVSSSIAVASGGIDDPNMHVFDVTTGAEISTLGDEYDGPWLASPAIADGIVYAVSAAGKVLASDPATGATLWTYHVEIRPNNGMIESGPVIANGVLYVSTDLGVIYALK